MTDFEEVIITISGLPGSGTSTAAKLLSQKTEMNVISTGEIFRELAKERGYSVEEFGEVAENDENIDIELDKRIVKKAKPGCILEGRLTGHMLSKSNKVAYKVWIEADLDARIERIADREHMDLERTKKLVKKREISERKRYLDYYKIDLLDTEIYDMVIDSTENSPEEIVSKIINGVQDGPY
ncbi:MAG: (d)CMP kinase [Thermoplasmatota archaeon]